MRVSKNVNESILIQYLQENPSALTQSQAELLEIIKKESVEQKDLTKHLRLIPPEGYPGFSDLKLFVNHAYYESNGRIRPASDLREVWNDFLKGAEKRIMLNVFDFDLEDIATTLIAKSRLGVEVVVGIDDETIEHRAQVKALSDRLQQAGVRVVAVDSPQLNHQKMAIVDWDSPDTARVLVSSGNLTQSCLGPEGDLVKIPAALRPEKSIPNANHVMTMRSWLLANLVANELSKALDSNYKLRGAQYPIQGSYQITGPGVDPMTLDAYPDNSLIVTFSPGGGHRDINKNVIGHFIRKSSGPFRMIQFAFSSSEVTQALLDKANDQPNNFDFLSVGDTPFALQGWSQFLKMSGYVRFKNSRKQAEFVSVKDSSFEKALGDKKFKLFQDKIRVAPSVYSMSKVKIQGQTLDVNAKIHHKILSTGTFAIMGTSFNFSNGAQGNNEQIIVFKNKALVEAVEGMARWLSEKSPRSVSEEALLRNRRVKKPEFLNRPIEEILNEQQDGNEGQDLLGSGI